MPRPETAQDVVELVRRSGLVGEPDLARLRERLPTGSSPEGAFGMLVTDGLLTPYQADELADGRWRGFWLGAYKVLDRLGKGGMGHVYLAEHAVLGKRVAVKVLSAGLRADPSARRRFVREARAAAAVDHTNIVHVHDVDVDHDPPFLVMEFVDGVSLQAAVARHGTFAAGETAAVGAEVARGLSAAASAGLVHRDVKPANLLIDRRGHVKILDLGIVRLPGDDTQPRSDGSEVILGTLDYLAPEQAVDSTNVDCRADLYALGATLYFLLAGHPPFPGSDLRHKLAAKQYSDPPPIHRLRPDIAPELGEVIQKLLCRDPATRYQTAAEVVSVLTSFAELPAEFPSRLFRSNHASTVSDSTPLGSDSSPLPVTQRILKLPPRGATPDPPPEESSDSDSDSGPPTDEVNKHPTDLAMTPLPDVPLADLSAVAPPPTASRAAPVAPAASKERSGFLWVLVGAALVAAGLGAVLASGR